MKYKIKEQFKDKLVGFNNSTAPLGKRKDLDKLAEIAIRSNDKTLLNLFEETPKLDEINKEKGKKIVDEVKKTK